MSNATRTPQQAMADAIKSGAVQAWIDGKNIQSRVEGKCSWHEVERYLKNPAFAEVNVHWRPAPTPRLRPWKPEEVPVGAVVREISGRVNRQVLTSENWSTTGLCGAWEWKWPQEPETAWHPCGVQEGGE